MSQTCVNLRLLPKQLAFVRSTAPEVMFSGAVRGSKTYALCVKTVARASRPGAREILCRKTLSSLKGTTMKTLMEGDGQTPPVLPPGSYTHNKSTNEIKIHGGGEIVCLPLVNDGQQGTQQRIGSYSATGVNGDEATEFEEKDYRMLLSRASVTVPGLVKQVSLSCNPGTPSHFLAKRFAPPGSGYTVPMAGCECISTRTHENTFLSADYIANLDRDKGSLWYRRFVEGLWCGAEGLVYDHWDRLVHVKQRRPEDMKRWLIGIDDGYTNPFVALLIGVDGDGRAHVFAEVYKPGLLVGKRVEAARGLIDDAGIRPEFVMVDPSSPDLIAELIEVGLSVIAANNEVVPGINAVHSRLDIAGDGLPRLTVDPTCENTIREFETYQWKKDKPKDEPVKAHDHACDAIRYAVARLDLSAPFVAAALGDTPTFDAVQAITQQHPKLAFAAMREGNPEWGFDD
jgi:hypothetical protein